MVTTGAGLYVVSVVMLAATRTGANVVISACGDLRGDSAACAWGVAVAGFSVDDALGDDAIAHYWLRRVLIGARPWLAQ